MTVSGAFGKAPKVAIPAVAASKKLAISTPIKGAGSALPSTDDVLANLAIYVWSGKTHKLLESTFKQFPAVVPSNLGLKGLATEEGTPRVDAAKELFASLGGTLECFYFSFGVEDLLVICDLPDNESAAAFSLAINNTGKAKGRVTPLMTPEEMDRATTKAPQYRAPGEP